MKNIKLFSLLLVSLSNSLVFSQEEGFNEARKIVDEKTMQKGFGDVQSVQKAVFTTCAGAAAADISVPLTTCADVGTAAYNTDSPVVGVDGAAATAPTTAPGCGSSVGGMDCWASFDITGSSFSFQFENGVSTAGGFQDLFYAFYQGGCTTQTLMECGQAIQFASGGYSIYDISVYGLDPSQDLLMYVWSPENKDYNLNFRAVSSNPPANSTCATATSGSYGCNLGAPNATWNTPNSLATTVAMSPDIACTGGSWGSNENTVYFSFIANQTTGSLDVNGVMCNDGTAGNAQFLVMSSCGCYGQAPAIMYGATCFKGCAAGAGDISLTSLVAGEDYFIAVDGYAGDNCDWEFVSTGIILPVEFIKLSGTRINDENVIHWVTENESDISYFELQKNIGDDFVSIDRIDALNSVTGFNEYFGIDRNPSLENTFYRLKQYDMNGGFVYQGPILFESKNNVNEIKVVPNPITEETKLMFSAKNGVNHVISIYDISGRKVNEFNYVSLFGNNYVDLKSENFEIGSYIVIINDGKNINSTKFVKQ